MWDDLFCMSLIGTVGDIWLFVFFQAEDGIRDLTVTGVQTCALPISIFRQGPGWSDTRACARDGDQAARSLAPLEGLGRERSRGIHKASCPATREKRSKEIGRASCRERV